jgi:3-oxoacyl-[acyl-carrier protein] reductase
MRRFGGRVVLVTGAASGFGEATVRRFHAEGAAVVVADVDEGGAKRVVDSLESRSLAVAVDVRVDAQVRALMAAAVSAFGRLDVLVNNAGIIHAKAPLEEIDDETFDRVVDVNLRGVVHGFRHGVPALRASGGGVILNTASVGALLPRRNTAVYSATKAAILSLTRTAAMDLAPNIRVNAVCPLAADTPFLAGSVGAAAGAGTSARHGGGASGGGASGGAVADYVARIRQDAERSVPLGRLATPADVAAAFAFLASDDASFITGVALPVDGGRTAGDTVGRVGVPEPA